MITCKLGEKKYSVDFISGRAMREIDEASKMYAKILKLTADAEKGEVKEEDANITIQDALDVLVRWFCIVFNNQFTPDELYDGYPVDRLMEDIILCLMAVMHQQTSVLSEFPTNPAAETKTKK